MTLPVLLIDGVDVTEEISGKQFTLKHRALDVTLIDPTSIPNLGDDVEVDEPVWAGIVASVTVQDNDYPRHSWVKITAINEDAPAEGAAPFGLVDTDGDYRKLTITRSAHNGEAETRGSLETLLPGLLPGMTFDLTSDTHGFAAEEFIISDVAVAWLNDETPIYRVSFGADTVTFAEWVLQRTGVGTENNAFPANPQDNDLFFRVDLCMWCCYDADLGRWVSAELFSEQLPSTLGPQTISVTTNGFSRLGHPLPDIYDILIESLFVNFYVEGGTALSGSHKWDGTFAAHPSTTSIGSLPISSGAKDTYRASLVVVDVMIPATDYLLVRSSWTKTGTPGNLHLWERVNYRLLLS